MTKKRRTRQHIIAELSANYLERWVLLCGYSVERIEHDYGIDLMLFTYDTNGEIENGQIFIQLKATDNLRLQASQPVISFAVAHADLELWLNEPMPCMLIVYDASEDAAYWCYLQAYFENLLGFDLINAGQSVTIQIPRANIVNEAAIRTFATYRDDVISQIEGVIRHRD